MSEPLIDFLYTGSHRVNYYEGGRISVDAMPVAKIPPGSGVAGSGSRKMVVG